MFLNIKFKVFYEMLKKGKFKLFSYIIEDFLIYFQAQNRKDKLLGFSIFSIKSYEKIIVYLNNWLKKGFINYYSIQFDFLETFRIYIILNFVSKKKSEILKFFNLIFLEIEKMNLNTQFFKNEELEKIFFGILMNSKYKIKLDKNKYTFHLYDGNNMVLRFYKVNLKAENKIILSNFLKLLQDLRRKGILIINNKIDNLKTMELSSFYIDVLKENNESGSTDLVNEVNNFFDLTIINKPRLKLYEISYMLLRYWPFKQIIELQLQTENTSYVIENNNLIEYNNKLVSFLIKNKLRFQRINQNITFINKMLIFIIFDKINFQLLERVLNKYYKKYSIYLLILDDLEFENMKKNEVIKKLSKLRIISRREFDKIDNLPLKQVETKKYLNQSPNLEQNN